MHGFEAHTLLFKTVVTSPLRLPPFKGSTLRGALAEALVSNFCVNPSLKSCHPCPARGDCPTSYLIATMDPNCPRGVDVPRPYVVRPPRDARTDYSVGDEIEFSVVVFGKALALLPYLVVAVQQMGQAGLGSKLGANGGKGKKGGFRLREIWAVNSVAGISQRIHQDGDGLVRVPAVPVVHQQVLERAEEIRARLLSRDGLLTLRMLTPLRLIDDRRLVRGLTFSTLFLRLSERIDALSGAYGEQRLTLDVPALLRQSEKVEIVAATTQWIEMERYSTRHGRRLPMGGLTGDLTVRGLLEPFLPWLVWGTQVAVGKYAVAGCGRYEMLVGAI